MSKRTPANAEAPIEDRFNPPLHHLARESDIESGKPYRLYCGEYRTAYRPVQPGAVPCPICFSISAEYDEIEIARAEVRK